MATLTYGKLLLVLTLATLNGCGGGGGGGSDPGTGNPGAIHQPGAPINPGLTGKLYLDGPTDYLELEMNTGIVTALRSSQTLHSSSVDGTLFVTSESLDDDTTDLIFMGRDGRTLSRFNFNGDLNGPRLSADGTLVATEWKPSFESGLKKSLLVIDRNGSIVASYKTDEISLASWAWLPDNTLVVSADKAIYHLAPATNNPAQQIQSFPEFTPFYLAASPDGRQLAFSMGNADLLENHVYVMNIDGTGLRQLTTSSLNEDAPAWSPDGTRIAIRQGIAYSALGAGIPSGGCPEVYIVPSDATNVTVGPAVAPPGVALRMLEDGTARGVCAFSGLAWRNTITPVSQMGTAIAGGGLNAGLEGRMFFEHPDPQMLDLVSGTLTTLPMRKGFNIFPSWDGNEIAYEAQDVTSGSYDNDEIVVQTLEGKVTADFELPQFTQGTPRLSPDNTLIAVEWHSIDLGDPGGINVVTVFDRNGNVKVRHSGYDHWSWMPDGRLALTAGDGLFLTDHDLQHPVATAHFGDGIGHFDISPDGTQVAFGMVGHAWTAHLDGSGLKQLTQSPTGEYGPVWAPDGKTLAVIADDDCPQVFFVPADGERVPIANPSLATSAVALREIEDGAERQSVCAFSVMAWR